VAGDDYTLDYTGGVSNYITIYDASFTAIAWGVSPLAWTAPSSGTFYSQPNLNDGLCGTDFSCHTGIWTNTSPPPACPPEVAPWLETFTTTVDPTCWSQSATTGGPWIYTGSPDFGNNPGNIMDHTSGVLNNYAWMDQSSTDVGVILQTPEIDVTALTVPELRFWIMSHNITGSISTYNDIFVEASDGAGGWTAVSTINGDFGFQWEEFTYIATPYIYGANLVQFRFRAESGGDINDYDNDMLLDDVEVREAPTCPQPTALAVIGSDATSITVEWTPQGSETEWSIEWGAPGFTPGTGMTALASPTGPYTYTITPLASNSFYEVYVRAACTPGDTSFYEGPVTGNTYNQPLYMDWNTDCPTSGFIDISATGVNNQLGDDGEVGVALPFAFLYQGVLMNDVTIGSNGGLILGTQTAQLGWTNGNMSAAADGFYPFWDDMGPEDAGQNEGVFYETIGTAPNQQFIVQWNKDRLGGDGTYIFEAIIDEASGEIWFVYDVVDVAEPGNDYGIGATIGIAGPSQDLEVSFNDAQYLTDNSCAHFFYTDCPSPIGYTVVYTTNDEGAITWGAGLAGETNWTVIYGPEGFDPLTGGTTINVTNPTATFPGLDDITTYDVYIYADCTPGVLQSTPATGQFTTLPNCSDVSGITALTAVDSVFSAWSWTESSGIGTYPSTGFNIQYGTNGFGLYDGTETIVNADNNYTDTTDNTAFVAGGVYDLYVQAACSSDTSNWVGPITFIMPLTNDTTCFAEPLMADGSVYVLNNAGATTDAGEAAIAPPATGFQTTDGWGNSSINFTTWFTFDAPASGNIRISGEDVGFDGQVAIYEVTDCGDFNTYTLLGANDDGEPGSAGFAPNLSLCGLTPGNTYYLMHDSWSTVTTGNYSLSLTPIDLEAGTSNGIINVCTGDTVDLFTGITGYDMGGIWTEEIATANFADPNFPSAGLAYQVFNFEYRVIDGCAFDSIVQQVEIYGPSSAGTDGSIDVCMNQPVDLLSGLGGNVDLGGTWYDPQNNTTASAITAASIPGQFNYDYITSNGVCPEDTANVIVNVLATCDYLNIDEMVFGNINMYPNPTNGSVFITNNGSIEVFDFELTDVKGKVIASRTAAINGTETTEVSLENLETGFYLIRVFNDNAEKTFRIIKE
jgi:hypothetical protein